MKKSLNKFVSFLIAIVIAFSSFNICFAEDKTTDGRRTLELIDFDDSSAITNANLVVSTEHTKDGAYSAYWNHNNATNIDMEKIPVGDWSEYSEINISIYGKNAGGTKFELVAFCEAGGYFHNTITVEEGQHDYALTFDSMKKSGTPVWSNISYVRITSSGWAMTPSYQSEYWINSFNLRYVEEGIARIYPAEDVDATYAAMQGNAGMYAGGSSLLIGNTVIPYNSIEWIQEATAVPINLFAEYLGADMIGNADSATITVNGKVLLLASGNREYSLNSSIGVLSITPYKKNDLMYVPGAQVAELLGYQVKTDGKLLIIGDEKVRLFDSNSKVSNMLEIVGYLTYANDIEPASIPDEEIELAKERWRSQIVNTDVVDTTDTYIKDIIDNIDREGNSAWSTLKTNRDNQNSLFFGDKFTYENTTEMTREFKRILDMAKMWAQPNSDYYQNEELLSDILYALEFQYEHRYGEDEIENNDNAWRDNTLTNWYDWQIDTPRVLVDILLLVDDELTQEQKQNYLKFFDYWICERAYSSMKSDGGMNVLYTVKNWIGSMLLQNDKEGLLDAVSCLHNCFAWADNFPTGEGYYTDGSYVFHYKHPMTGQYGITQFEQSGLILSCIKGTSFDFRNPRRENIFDWIYDAFEPIIFDGAIFRYVKGRAVTVSDHNIGRQFVKGMINLLEFADEENSARIKSLIKYYVQTDKSVDETDSANSFTLPQYIILKEILDDETIKVRTDYYTSKTYSNMDKIAHQRKTWAFGVSMSSSRIYDYECINGENTTGWYTSDGMTQLMLANDQKQFNSGYWDSVDPYKYPGITADTQERDAHTIDTGNAFVKDFDFVGGATLGGEYTTAAQKLNAFHLDEDTVQRGGNVIKAHNSSLVAQKSWFLFDDEIVCLGAGINANDGFDVRTIVENRKSNKLVSYNSVKIGSEKVTVNGVETSVTDGELTREDVDWVNLENVGGYYFPEDGNVTMNRTTGEKSFFEMWIEHGVNPSEQGYAYVILPTQNAAQTQAYAQNPGVEILCNTDKISAVYDKSSGSTGVVFWEAGTFEGITVDKPMIMMYKRTEDGLKISVSDPTHKLLKANIKTNSEYLSIDSLDKRIELAEDGKGLEINFASSDGASIEGILIEEPYVKVEYSFIDNANNNVLTDVPSSGTVNICAKVENATVEKCQATLLVVARDKTTQKSQVILKSDELTIESGRTDFLTDGIEMSELTKNCEIKAYVWNIKNLKPYSATIGTLPSPAN